MSIIIGLHLPTRLYLISDTRLSILRGNGKEYSDNLIKSIPLGNYVSVAVAGTALPASYLLNRIKEKTNKESTITEVMSTIDLSLKGFVSDYVNMSGKTTGKVGMIIGGFDRSYQKDFQSDKLGSLLSEYVSKRGIGLFKQRVNNKIITALFESINQNGGTLPKGSLIKTRLQSSQMFSILIDIASASYDLKEVECFDMACFEPKTLEHFNIPDDVISAIEFPSDDQYIKNIKDRIYRETEVFMTSIQGHIKKHNLTSVGGFLFPIMIAPLVAGYPYASFPTGQQGYYNSDGKIEDTGNLKIVNGKFMSRDGNGEYEEYILIDR